jgi:Family of unknown function (DUF5329)
MKFLMALLLSLLLPAAVAAAGMTEAQKIEAMIVSVEKLPGAVFIRNGTDYDAIKAAGHLRMKWKKAGKRVRTAEDFIKYCGSVSSMSGEKYQIRFADGRTVYSGDYFHEQLRRIEASQAPAIEPKR